MLTIEQIEEEQQRLADVTVELTEMKDRLPYDKKIIKRIDTAIKNIMELYAILYDMKRE